MPMHPGIRSIHTQALTALALGSVVNAISWLIPSTAIAASIKLDFEGLKNIEFVDNYYNNGQGSLGSLAGPSYGINFSSRAMVSQDSDEGGRGDFGGNPSGSKVLFLPQFLGEPIQITEFNLNVETGFTNSLSFYYSAPFIDFNITDNNITSKIQAKVSIFDGLNGQGNQLGSLNLSRTPFKGAPDPNGIYSPFIQTNLNFTGVGRSVVFSGTSGFVAYDDISLKLIQPPPAIPTPALLPGLIGLGLKAWRRSRHES